LARDDAGFELGSHGRFGSILGKQFLNESPKAFDAERFSKCRIALDENRPVGLSFRVDERGKENDRRVSEPGIVANVVGKERSVHVWHHEIEDEQVGIEIARGGEGRERIALDADFVLRHRASEQPRELRLIVNDQDLPPCPVGHFRFLATVFFGEAAFRAVRAAGFDFFGAAAVAFFVVAAVLFFVVAAVGRFVVAGASFAFNAGSFPVTARAAVLAVFTVSEETSDFPLAERVPMIVPAMPPTTAPTGPAMALPTMAPATPPAVCFETGKLLWVV
jgi:hypothetical protein